MRVVRMSMSFLSFSIRSLSSSLFLDSSSIFCWFSESTTQGQNSWFILRSHTSPVYSRNMLTAPLEQTQKAQSLLSLLHYILELDVPLQKRKGSSKEARVWECLAERTGLKRTTYVLLCTPGLFSMIASLCGKYTSRY